MTHGSCCSLWLNQPVYRNLNPELYWVDIYQNLFAWETRSLWSRWNPATDVMLVWADGAKKQKKKKKRSGGLVSVLHIDWAFFIFKKEDRIPDNNPSAWKWDQELISPNSEQWATIWHISPDLTGIMMLLMNILYSDSFTTSTIVSSRFKSFTHKKVCRYPSWSGFPKPVVTFAAGLLSYILSNICQLTQCAYKRSSDTPYIWDC